MAAYFARALVHLWCCTILKAQMQYNASSTILFSFCSVCNCKRSASVCKEPVVVRANWLTIRAAGYLAGPRTACCESSRPTLEAPTRARLHTAVLLCSHQLCLQPGARNSHSGNRSTHIRPCSCRRAVCWLIDRFGEHERPSSHQD